MAAYLNCCKSYKDMKKFPLILELKDVAPYFQGLEIRVTVMGKGEVSYEYRFRALSDYIPGSYHFKGWLP